MFAVGIYCTAACDQQFRYLAAFFLKKIVFVVYMYSIM